ncbi:hypothetical protein GCM10011416_23450 [Polaribacter pacificus]|uniref:DUF4268 domain-containing protein n=1 Tax=Polaribacter pacificus TaxID=1775173 RepID=A0A917I2M1_9FLAO|nr:DUF4268 domain-containing protein [Polaribacter pacificus]GGH03733.1 hypothetical protein GCM10011416_23450 [Polaribacter pacificus]
MFTKEEAAQLRKEFWTSFGKSFPRKWLLYNTQIKGFSFKFLANKKQAAVCLDIEHSDEITNELLYDQLLSLRSLLEQDVPEVIFDDTYELENGKIIHRIYIPFDQKFSIHNKNTWQACFEFFVEKMNLFEFFFYEYEDHIKQAIR